MTWEMAAVYIIVVSTLIGLALAARWVLDRIDPVDDDDWRHA